VLDVVVNGQPSGAGLVAVEQDGRLWLPLSDCAPILGFTVVHRPDVAYLRTPLGEAYLTGAEGRIEGGEWYVPIEVLASRLAARIVYRPEDQSLRVALPWSPADASPPAAEEPLRPDVSAPTVEVNRLRGEALVRYDRDTGGQDSGYLEVMGVAGPGEFQSRLTRTSGEQWALSDYVWIGRFPHTALSMGHQYVNVLPLLPSFHFTGAQVAWSRNRDQWADPIQEPQLLHSLGGNVRTLRGRGPPGGIVELRVDDRVVRRERIPLNGEYILWNVEWPPGYSYRRLYLYRPFEHVPASIVELEGWSDPLLMAAGDVVVAGGGGIEGNPADPMVRETGGAGFGLARWGASDALTLETAVQTTEVGARAAAGGLWSAGRLGLLRALVGIGDDATAALLSLHGGSRPWFWNARLQETNEDFDPRGYGIRSDRFAEAGIQWDRLQLSLIGRRVRWDGGGTVYLLPAADWRPLSGLSLRSRPDWEGDYVHEAEWVINRYVRCHVAARPPRYRGGVEVQWSERHLSHLSAERYSPDGSIRYAWVQSWRGAPHSRWRLEAGLLATHYDVGALGRIAFELFPGLWLRLDGTREPAADDRLFRRERWWVTAGVSFDFARSSAGLTRAGSMSRHRGAVAGRIVGAPSDQSLKGTVVRVNGRPGGACDENGRFLIPNLEPGLHRVELDDEGLPLELASAGQRFTVEVRPGAITPVEFQVRVQLGAAGRVRRAGSQPLSAGWRVEVIDPEGTVVRATEPAPDGRWQVDGLPPGRYRAVLKDPAGRSLAEIPLVLEREYLLKQDFTVEGPEASETAPDATPVAPRPPTSGVRLRNPFAGRVERLS